MRLIGSFTLQHKCFTLSADHLCFELVLSTLHISNSWNYLKDNLIIVWDNYLKTKGVTNESWIHISLYRNHQDECVTAVMQNNKSENSSVNWCKHKLAWKLNSICLIQHLPTNCLLCFLQQFLQRWEGAPLWSVVKVRDNAQVRERHWTKQNIILHSF